ncbi:hypothetical protein FH609_000755 [Streptomyces sp. 3MP-14]|uniref:Uncharacterized protein n=1 Tax=Streptomyces mimosae TaxID=2586635 RepID=A0A5N6AR26_9ACTN|nr:MULTISPECIES: hypothetical protein [Streptomyces]KAB8171064.1 hypothetical protein FH607_001715 [Streptomyces mimosae]KAB8179584.1 hypothetical protein FH609_000755 [Streptomyces sp. 3MP-14]
MTAPPEPSAPGAPPHAPAPLPAPAPAPARASLEHGPRYLVAGVLLLVFGGGVIAWVLTGINDSPASSVDDLLRALVDPLHAVDLMALTPYEWMFAVALVTVAVLALCQRRVARGGALVLAFLLLALCLRQAVGALDEDYRAGFDAPTYGPWTLTTYGVGLLLAATVLILLLPAREPAPTRHTAPSREPAGQLPPGEHPGGPRPLGTLGVLGGSLLIALALADIAWTLDNQRLAAEYDLKSWGEYFRDLVDPSLFHSPTSLTSGVYFHEAALAVSMLVVGVLACLGRPVARGAGLTLLAMAAYLEYRTVVLTFRVGDWSAYVDSTRGTLMLLTMLLSVPALLIAIFGLGFAGSARAPRRQPPPAWPHPGPPPFPH